MCAEYLKGCCAPAVLLFKPKSIIAQQWSQYCEKMILSGKYLKEDDWGKLSGYALGKIIRENNCSDKVMKLPSQYIFSLGYENRSYMNYYSMNEGYINEQLQQIKIQGAKVITLYGTFMYNLPIPNQCLLERMEEMAKNVR
jgi:hypothetical protein